MGRLIPYRSKALFARYRAEISITSVATLFSTLVAILLTAASQPSFAEGTFWLITLLSTSTILLAAVLFNQKRLHYRRFHQLNKIISTFFAFDLYDNEYSTRQDHFKLEKALIAQRTVTHALPEIFHAIKRDQPDVDVINLVIESGTQMTALFPFLLDLDTYCGDLFNTVDVRVHTNNLAGIDELHKVSEYRYSNSAVGRRQLTLQLIGGQQHKRYRATLGQPALQYLQCMWDAQEKANTESTGSERLREVTVGILTGNWLLGGGLDLAQVALCARDRDHYRFKASVAAHAQYVLLLAPLGKLLPLSDARELNEIAEQGGQPEPYEVIEFDVSRRARTFLLTSLRPGDSLSPLERSSAALARVAQEGGSNFTLSANAPCFDPGPHLTREEVFRVELPHCYIRQNYGRVFADRR